MKYNPPYWFHDNIKFSDKQIQELKDDLNKAGDEKYDTGKSNISSYFLKFGDTGNYKAYKNMNLDKKFNEVYYKVVESITKNVGIYHRVKYYYSYWSQLYKKDMKHVPHHHAGSNEIISWVHFLDEKKKKCFRFTDTRGNTLYPDEQSNGDIICFPAWVWHEAVPHNSDHERLVIAGNILIKEYDH